MNQIASVNQALDEMLVQLGGVVLRLSSPKVTRTPEERHALACSVNQYAVCAARAGDPRVHQLKAEREATIKPHLRLVVSPVKRAIRDALRRLRLGRGGVRANDLRVS